MLRWIGVPVAFTGGWIFNFVIDIKFMAGFVAGWASHSWLGGVLSALGLGF